VDYDLHVAGDLATGRATLTIDVLKDGWVRVPVPAGLLVREARLDGKAVSLVPGERGKSGTHVSALLSHAGRSVLLLDVDVAVTSSAGDESLALPATESGVTRASVQLPRQGVDLRVGGGMLSEKSEADGATKWLAYARGNEALTFTWRRKTEDHHVELPLRLRGSLTQLTSLAEDSTSVYAEANFEIVQGAAREIKIQLPEKITINQVSGAMVADWEMKNGELAVTFLEPVEHSARFVITGESRLPRDGIIDIPLLRLENTERDEGGVAVEVLGAGEIKGTENPGTGRGRRHRSWRTGGEPAIAGPGRVSRSLRRRGCDAIVERERGSLRSTACARGEHRRGTLPGVAQHRRKGVGAGPLRDPQ
jgi:hypothetical protein